MKLSLQIRQLLALFVVLFVCAGCRHYYMITMTNAISVTAYSRPKKLPNGYYMFIDAKGRTNYVNAMRVRSIDIYKVDKNRITFDDSIPQPKKQ